MIKTEFQELEIPIAGSAVKVSARLYEWGKTDTPSKNIMILSNTSTNRQEEWDPLVATMSGERDERDEKFAVLTYTYPEGASLESALEAVIEFVESEGRTQGEERIVLAGAGRGGAVSLRVAARRGDDNNIVGLVAISTPLEFEGERLYTDGDLRMIIAPKLVISSEFEDGVEDSRNIFALLEDPRQLTIYPGDAHGTDLFLEHGESLTRQLREFALWAMRR